MKKEELFEIIGEVDEHKVYEAGYAMSAKKKVHLVWFKWVAIAACVCFVVAGAIRIGIGLAPSQMTDIRREGNLIEITQESELPAVYDGKLLAFNLNFEKYEFYYKYDGVPENTDDWYTLLAAKYDAEKGDILLHCMFDAATKENPNQDWKVDSVFTPEATQKKTINGVEVEIAQNEYSLKYKYWHYVIFIFDGVVYDVRVQSDNPEYVYEVLNQLLSVV